jgi:hypothetical protein
MPYNLPSSEEWDQFLKAELDEVYLKSLEDNGKAYRIQQVQLIKSFQSLPDAKQRNALLMGACIHIAERISQEKKYKYLISAEKSNHLLKYSLGLGSTLFTKIKNVLKSSESTLLDDKTKLIYLQFFYDFVKLNPQSIAKCKLSIPELQNEINESIERVIGRSAVDIHLLISSADALVNDSLNKRSADKALLNKFKQIPPKYEDKTKNRSYFDRMSYYMHLKAQDPDRPNQIKFIEMLVAHCKIDDAALIYGYLLYCIHVINSSNSDLYSLCAEVTDMKDERFLNSDKRHAYYSRLNMYVSDRIAEGKWQQLEEFGFNNPSSFFRKMQKNLDKINGDISHPENKIADYPYLNAMTACAAGLGIRVLCGPVATTLGQVIGASGGLLSVVRPDVVVIGTLIASFVTDGMISGAASTIAGNVNALVIEGTKQTIIITYHSLKQLAAFGKSVVLSEKESEMKSNRKLERISDRDDIEWINALLRVDESIFPKFKKDILRQAIADDLSEREAPTFSSISRP